MATFRILFVCTGNTCRSPLAEGLCRMAAKREGMDIEVRSAGISAVDGMSVSRHSGDILRDKGAAAGVNGSLFLREEAVRWADLLLTMTMSHKRVVIERHPEAVDKAFTLKEYVEDDPGILNLVAAREAFFAELQLKQALGQKITDEERQRLLQLHAVTPDFDITDPFGGSRKDYDAAAREIEQAVEKLLRKLKSSHGG